MQGSLCVCLCVCEILRSIYCVYNSMHFFNWLAAYILWQLCLAAMLITCSIINESTGGRGGGNCRYTNNCKWAQKGYKLNTQNNSSYWLYSKTNIVTICSIKKLMLIHIVGQHVTHHDIASHSAKREHGNWWQHNWSVTSFHTTQLNRVTLSCLSLPLIHGRNDLRD
jgi:hypothetical protein